MGETDPVPWHSDEEFWTVAYPFMFPADRLAAAEEQVEQVLALAGVAAGAVLDLACGPGRHSIVLARAGFRVTGVDRSTYLLDRARQRAAAEQVDVEWVREDMRVFRRPDTFDLCLSLFTSFGYFRDQAENRRVLENALVSLRPGGAMVMDMMGKEIVARGFEPTGAEEVAGAGVVVQRRTVVDDWSRMENEWILIDDERVRRFTIDHWMYSGAELKTLLHDAGFVDVRLFGDLAGSAYGPRARRLVALATRPV